MPLRAFSESMLPKVTKAREFEEKVLHVDSPVVVLFDADWCPYCKAFSPILEKRIIGVAWSVVSVPLNDYDDPLWDRYSIDVVPSLAVFDGGKIVFRVDGVLGIGLKDADIARLIEYFNSRREKGT